MYLFLLPVNPNLTNAIVCTGETYEEIAKMVDDQPRNDWEPLGDMMHDYRGMLAGWPSVLQIHAVSFFCCLKKHYEKATKFENNLPPVLTKQLC